MKIILFFVILWHASPIEVEKKAMKEFNSMIECEQTQSIFREAGKHKSLILTNDKGIKGLVIGSLCEKIKEEQTT